MHNYRVNLTSITAPELIAGNLYELRKQLISDAQEIELAVKAAGVPEVRMDQRYDRAARTTYFSVTLPFQYGFDRGDMS